MEGSESSPAADGASGFRVYGDYIAEQVANQEARKQSIESRGAFVITTSGALATITLALSGFAAGDTSFEIEGKARLFVGAALFLFVLAAALALVANLPLRYKHPLTEDLRESLESYWGDDEHEAMRLVSENRLDIVERAREVNGWKAWLLVAAMATELAAIIAIAVAVAIIL